MLESFSDLGDGGGEGDELTLFAGMDGDGSSESATDSDFKIFSSISPITTNEGSTMYWIKPRKYETNEK